MNKTPEPARKRKPAKIIAWAAAALFALALLALPLALALGRSAMSRLARQYPPPGKMVDAGGFKMHINCSGEGSPTVILEAGASDFSVMWSLVQPHVSSVTRVCSYDRAGFGWSGKSPRARSANNMVLELHTLLGAAGIKPPYILAGHSFGGALSLVYAKKYPGEVTGVVLVDAAPPDLIDRIPEWRKVNDYAQKMFDNLSPLGKYGIAALVPSRVPDPGLPADALAQYRAAIAASPVYFDAARDESGQFIRNLMDVKKAVGPGLGDMPLIVISRGQPGSFPPALSKEEADHAWVEWSKLQSELTSLSTNGKQITADESAHNIHLTQPQLVVDAINELVTVARTPRFTPPRPGNPYMCAPGGAPAPQQPLSPKMRAHKIR